MIRFPQHEIIEMLERSSTARPSKKGLRLIMVDMFTVEKRSRIMANIRSRGNHTTELRLIQLMRQHQIRGWRRGSKLPGRPDFIFPKQKIALFIDGDFWHGNPDKYRLPKSNIEYWAAKIEGNKRRDRLVTEALQSRGWKVERFWESDLRKKDMIASKLKSVVMGL